ncbi:small ribosomal subunit protein mS23 [Brachionichthys hirsutus]|uniref:small ribosomal subunit protein mS23 n=1 Tax=Brachionichthys hirsutus TaxID=412623 RepID=UPI0036054004
MAGSRLEKFGTVFTRVRDLVRAGVRKPTDVPIWYHVYGAFPPVKDPLYVKPHSKAHLDRRDAVPEIFYEEDAVRAKFYERFTVESESLDLSNPKFISTCQRFVDKYTDLERGSDLEAADLFQETEKALFKDGIRLRRRAAKREPKPPDLLRQVILEGISAEQPSVAADGEDTADRDAPTRSPAT